MTETQEFAIIMTPLKPVFLNFFTAVVALIVPAKQTEYHRQLTNSCCIISRNNVNV